MRKLIVIAAMLLWCLPVQQQVTGESVEQQNYEFINGRWFDGQSFAVRKFYTAGGLLTSKKPDRVDRVIDLSGKYIVPPFGEAHNHNAEGAAIDDIIRKYLEAGIFYVKNPNSLLRTTEPVRGKVNIPTSIDVTFANGGLTATGGHPMGLVRRNIERGIFTEADGDGAFVFIIDTRADLDRKWEKIKAGKPDFIKTYLLYSEEYLKRKDDEKYFAWKGLDPNLLSEIVRRAHRDGLRVSTHIESAADFHNALMAGVDEINHMPGFRADEKIPISRYEISEEDARLAARKGVVVVTTLGATMRFIDRVDRTGPNGEMAKKYRDLLVGNLRILKKHNVRIAIGSDQYRETSVPEALSLHEWKVFDNLTLLKMWCETTAEAIFPGRKIGRLKEGYEASFLALGGDPLQDFTNVQKIEMRIKQGNILQLSN
ncbi:MAG: amidohydrolase family protein [Blastocatellia bacterium]|nr:amidohydrolase family protein [Blastocatellia bacterium]